MLNKIQYFLHGTSKPQLLRSIPRSKQGMGTLEVVLIVAALLALGILFHKHIMNFAQNVFESVFAQDKITDMLS